MSETDDTPPSAGETERTIAVEDLWVMNRLGELGVEGIERRLGRLGGKQVAVTSERVRSGYVTDRTVETTFGESERVGTRTRLTETPHGFVLVLFPLASANNAATLMLSDAVEDLESAPNELAHSALVELGAIVANGFLDAWSDAFEERVDVGTPVLVHDDERSLIEKTIGREGELGLYIASTVHSPTHEIDADIYVFPRMETFSRLLDGFDPDQVQS